jgi:hypothetical protein
MSKPSKGLNVSRGEIANTPFNVFLVALSAFVAWGRRPSTLRSSDS